MELVCGESNCRKRIQPNDFDTYYKEWDDKIKKAIGRLFEVNQPLLALVDNNVKIELDGFFSNPESYKSVYSLKFHSNG